MTKKLYDLAVKTGSYRSNTGEEKNRYLNVGSILQMDDGGKMILLNRAFNPAGVPFREGSDQIIISMFPPKDESSPSYAAPPPASPRRSAAAPLDDEIAF
jgi:hypothetical protein